MVRNDREGVFFPVLCAQCERPACAAACPYGALTRVDGVVKLEAEKCRGCRLCILVCPFGAISLWPGEKTVQKCDLCGGDPLCAHSCPSGCLSFGEEEAYNRARRRELAARALEEHVGLEGRA